MPNKLGTLDSLHNHWRKDSDSINRTESNAIENGVTYRWFTALSRPAKDTLKLSVWLMEHAREEMLYVGFNEVDLKKEIDYWDYLRYFRAKRAATRPDSIRYDKLFNKVSALKLILSTQELDLLIKNILDMGFLERGNVFFGNDIKVEYTIQESDHAILQQIDFRLTRSTTDKEIRLNRLRIRMSGKKASFFFDYL